MKIIIILALLLCACVDKKTTNVLSPPADIQGSYSVAWSSPPGLAGVAQIAGDTVSFSNYPCRPLGSSDLIGGTFSYAAPDFSAEIKSIDGAVRIAVAGTFAGTEMRGTFEVLVLGTLCTSGSVVMERN